MKLQSMGPWTHGRREVSGVQTHPEQDVKGLPWLVKTQLRVVAGSTPCHRSWRISWWSFQLVPRGRIRNTLCSYSRAEGSAGRRDDGSFPEVFKDMALNLVPDTVGCRCFFGVDRAIIMGDSVKCAGAPVINPRQKRVPTDDDRCESRYGTSICCDLHSTRASERARYTSACCDLRSTSYSDRSTTRDAVTYEAPAPVTEVRHWHLPLSCTTL